MREIKFRAWDKTENIMIGSQEIDIEFTLGNDGHGNVGAFVDKCDGEGIEWTRRGNLILMQYTGLKDKNGKEIYEGDVVRIEINERPHVGIKICEVKYAANTFAYFSLKPIDFDDSKGNFGHLNTWYNPEIIGNIYKNPELLKG